MDTDILIIGAGVAGLTAAAALRAQGRDVRVVDPKGATAITDPRSTAYLVPSVALLREAGVWPKVEADAAALHTMRIIEDGASTVEADFNAADIGEDPFGWNVPNEAMRAALLAMLPADSLHTAALAALTPRREDTVARLDDGTRLAARLVIAADGRGSPARTMAGITTKSWGYGQTALATIVGHGQPHQNISTEIHRAGGPFTLVPLPDRNGRPASALVWLDTTEEARRRQSLNDADFEAEMNLRSLGVLGPLTRIAPIRAFDMTSQIATRLNGPRLALIGEAAHVFPPIGAQGLNTTIADIAALLRTVETSEDPGAPTRLTAYHRARWPEIAARVAGVDLLNRVSMLAAPPLQNLRGKALKAMHSAAPIRKTLMRAGLTQSLRK